MASDPLRKINAIYFALTAGDAVKGAMPLVWFFILLVTFWSVACAQNGNQPGGGFGRFLAGLFWAVLLTVPTLL
jgi:hypothetical protein